MNVLACASLDFIQLQLQPYANTVALVNFPLILNRNLVPNVSKENIIHMKKKQKRKIV